MVKWCTVSLAEVLKAGKRLEASVFEIEIKNAFAILEKCACPKIPLISKDGFAQKAYYGNRLKRNYIDYTDKNAIGFIGSSEMLDIKPSPIKCMNRAVINIKSLTVGESTILISRSGTIGNVTYVGKTLSKLLVSEHAIRLECNKFSGYVYCFLKNRIGRSLVESKTYGAVISQIEPEHIAGIPVPNPPDAIKEKIHNSIVRSFELRDDSNVLLDKATALLVAELHLPPLHELSTKRLGKDAEVDTYSVKLSSIAGRLDASYHVPVVDAIIEHLKNNAGELTTVGNKRISSEIILPGRFKRVYVEEGQGRVFFGGKQLFELDPANKKYLSLSQHDKRIKAELEITENTILITRSGSVGKVMITPKHWEYWIASDHIIRTKPISKDIAGYLYVFLASEYGNYLIKRYTYGSVVDEIDANHVSKIPIPLLKNQDTQREINDLALEANKLRYEAYMLEKEAMKVLHDEVLYAK